MSVRSQSSDPGTSAPSAGRTGRKRALPGGRAVAGGFAVAAAVVLVLAAFASGGSPRHATWVVATTDLRAGVPLRPGDLTTASLGLGSGATAGAAFTSPDQLVGRTLSVPVGAGELVLAGEVTGARSTQGLRPVPVTAPPADLVDLAPGDLVDVLVTEGTPPRTVLALRGARVLVTTQPSSGLLGSGGDPVVTVGVQNLAEVEALIAAEHAGTVDLVVGTGTDGTGLGGTGLGGTGLGGTGLGGGAAIAGPRG